jgi:hypothetical protein
LGLFARQVEVAGRVGRDRAGAAQPGEKPADRSEPRELGVDDQVLRAELTSYEIRKLTSSLFC